MKIRGFLLILCLLFVCYLGQNYREGLQNEIEENDVFKNETKYARHKERQKKCLDKIINNNNENYKISNRKPTRKPSRRPTRKPSKSRCSQKKPDKHDKCKHLLPRHRKLNISDKYFFNKNNYMLKTKMVPPVSPKGPYFKVVNENNKRDDYDEGSGKRERDEIERDEIERDEIERDEIKRENKKYANNQQSNNQQSENCKACANCKNGSGFTCDKAPNYSFANMNSVPPPITSKFTPPFNVETTTKYEPRPMLSSFSAFGR